MAGEPSGDLAVRVLFAGACQGQFGKLLKKVEKVNVKNGPFDALFCVGQFFNEDGTNNDGEFTQFLDSGQKMPITTYIIGAYGVGCRQAKEKLQQMDCNVHLMGKRGILTLQNGLKVAYLEGTYDADVSTRMEEDNAEGQYYSIEDVVFLRNLVQSQSGDIDFFLSCEWPANITSRLTTTSVEGPIPEGSQYISSLLSVIRPRYHFTSQPPLFFSRPPYKNPDLGAGSHVTRFTSLCPFGSGKKQNLFALCLTPAQHMSHEKLLEIPYDATAFPFHLEERKREFNPKEGQSRANQQSKRHKKSELDVNKNMIRDRRKTCFVGQLPIGISKEDIINYFSQAGEVSFVVKRQNDEGHESNWAFVQFTSQESKDAAIQTLDQTVFAGKRIVVKAANEEPKFDPNEPVQDCWFCLGSPSSDKGLIVSIGNESYVTVDKGPIVDEHVLVIPTSHYNSTLLVPESCYEEMELYLTGLRALFASEGKVLIAFERYLQLQKLHGNHTHLSVISIDPKLAQNAKEVFIQNDKKQGSEWKHLPVDDCNRDRIRDVVGDEEYLLVILPDGSKLVRPILKKTRLPVSFGRDVFAQLVGAPERADWKVCVSSREDELSRVENVKRKFQPYDYPNKA